MPKKKSGPFQRVWDLVCRIPRGRVATYGQLSTMIDRRLTPVGVGWAIRAAGEDAIPWHRVVNGRGGISTDGEHPGLQRAMLEAEGVVFGADGTLDLDEVGWKPRAPKSTKKRKPATASPARRSPPRRPRS